MGMLDKLKFWKKEPEEFDMGKFPSLEQGPGLGAPTEMGGMAPPSQGLTEMPDDMAGRGMDAGRMPGMEEIGNAPPAPFPGMGSEGAGRRGQMPAPSSFAPAPIMQSPSQDSRDMQVVNAKLDTLKALLDSVNAKLDRMERNQTPKEEEAIPLSVRRWR